MNKEEVVEMTKLHIGEWKDLLILYKFGLDEINTKLKILNEEFKYMYNHNPIEHLKSRVKDPAGITEKLKRKGCDPTKENAREYVQDIAGIRIICSFVSDIYKIYDMLDQQDDIHVIEVKDYIENPKPNGYKSLHLILEVPVFLSNRTEMVKVEVQIRTVAMDFWAGIEHKLYYKYEKSVPDHLAGELLKAAETVHALDDKMSGLKKEVDLLEASHV
ncbi:GTP pyrophosphokinase family protein [Halobacillus sp. Cin3]|uniref:GTP pyrophosphokinase n=1 Tax=Halobacillus sp. Cin3 TaxID=2928441 RepID=UPI00248E5A86|nr:GTP pyrophosphokinase family protein [Halobacillus sp. Cin3]